MTPEEEEQQIEFGYAKYAEDQSPTNETNAIVSEYKQFNPRINPGDEAEGQEMSEKLPDAFKYDLSEKEAVDRGYSPMEKVAPLTVADSGKFSNQ